MDYQSHAVEMAKTLKRLEATIAVVAAHHPDCPHVAAMAAQGSASRCYGWRA